MRSLMLGEKDVSLSTPPISWRVASSALRKHLERDRIEREPVSRHEGHSTSSTPLACTSARSPG
jgi:hypothetical protein